MAIPSPQVISTVDTVSDQRLDIDGAVWQLSTNTNESVILYGITDNAGTNYEIGYLKERPAALNFYGSNAAPAVSGETEVTTLGAIASNKFYVDYDRAFILFPNGHSTPVNVTYKGMGSIQKAKDVNEAIRAAEFSRDKYLGGQGSAPTQDADGVNLASGHEGILYFDNSTNKMKVWSGSAWGNATSEVEGIMVTTEAVGSGSTGSPSNQWYVCSHDAGNQTVYLNGVRQIANTDYKSVNSNSSTTHMTSGVATHIYFVAATDNADVISMVALGTVSSIDVVAASGGTFTGAVTASAGLTANTADINAGTFDGVVGGTTPAVGTFTTLVATTINGTEINHNDSNNIGIGATALNSITTGDYNVALGASALTAVTGTNESVAIGHQACEDNTAAESTAVGTAAMLQNVDGTGNTALGHSASLTNVSGDNNTSVGYKTLYNNTANANTGMGWAALHNNTADANTAVGYAALYTHTTGSFCTAIGYEALSLSNTNTDNTAVGYQALKNCVVGASLQTGAKNCAVGAGALTGVTDGYQNTAMGYLAGYQMAGGRDNVAIGYGAMYAGTGNVNTCVGWQAGLNLSTGGGNVLIGAYAGTSVSPLHQTSGSDGGCWGNDLTGPNYIEEAWTSPSDERDKADIVPMTHGLNVLEGINPINYFWDKRTYYWDRSDMDNIIKHEGDGSKKKSDLRVGFSAQNVKAALDAVGYTGNSVIDSEDSDRLKITETSIIPFLVNAVKELSAKVKVLEAA